MSKVSEDELKAVDGGGGRGARGGRQEEDSQDGVGPKGTQRIPIGNFFSGRASPSVYFCAWIYWFVGKGSGEGKWATKIPQRAMEFLIAFRL